MKTSKSGKKYDLSSLRKKDPETPAAGPSTDEENVKLDNKIAEITSRLSRLAPRLDSNFISNLPGNWRTISADASIKALIARASRTFKPGDLDNYSENLVQRRIKESVLSALTKRINMSSYSEIVNETGDKVRVYATARTSGKTSPTPIGNNEDIKLATDGIAKVKESINFSSPVLVSIVGPSSKLPDGSVSTSGLLGYAFPGGGSHILAAQIKKSKRNESDAYDPEKSWHSVPGSDYETRFTSTLHHEIGHTLMYNHWGVDSQTGKDDGSKALVADYKKFGVAGQVVSVYGKKNTSEHFAEAFTRYISTGEATPEFLDLLGSKGLLKSQSGETETQATRTSDSTPGDSDTAIKVDGLDEEDPPKFDDDKFYDVTISPRIFEELKQLSVYDILGDDGFVFKPGKYIFSGSRARVLFERYETYLKDFDAAPDEPGLVTAARVGAKYLRESSKSPKEATAEKAPSKTKKNRIKEIRDQIFNLPSELYYENENPSGRLLSREEYETEAKRAFSDLKAAVESAPDSDDTRRMRERRSRVKEGEQAYLDIRLSDYDEYVELTKELRGLASPNTIAVDGLEGPPDAKTAVKSSKDAKEKVLAGITEAIGKGEIPWRKPFSDGLNFAGEWVPRNPSSKRIYTGINALVLQHEQSRNDYKDPRWMTYKQAQAMGGQVRRGETGVSILVPIPRVTKEKDPTTGNEKVTGGYTSFVARSVFNVAQIDGLNLPTAKEEAGEPKTPLESQDFILERYKKSMEAKGLEAPRVRYTYVGEYGNHASSPNWNPLFDEITLPTKEQFNSPEEMFNTIAHELAHSTGHPKRLDRSELLNNYGKDRAARGREELIAEISSAILASMFGVDSVYDNQAAYVQSWMKAIKDDPSILGVSASEAQKVVDYLLGMDLGDWSPVEGYSVGSKASKDEE